MNNTTPANSVALLDISPPHGGQLVNRMLRGQMRQAVREKAEHLQKINLNPMNLSDLELIAIGAMSPLTGFMGQVDYERVVSEMRLSNNLR
jgi:sulfate adenylyltransferase